MNFPNLPCIALGEELIKEGKRFEFPEEALSKLMIDQIPLIKFLDCRRLLWKDSGGLCFFAEWWWDYQTRNCWTCKNCRIKEFHICQYHVFVRWAIEHACKNHKIEYCIPMGLEDRIPRLNLPGPPTFRASGTHKFKKQLVDELDEYLHTQDFTIDWKKIRTKESSLPYYYLRPNESEDFHVVLIHPKTKWRGYAEKMYDNSYVILRVYPEVGFYRTIATILVNLMELIIHKAQTTKVEWKTKTLVEAILAEETEYSTKMLPRKRKLSNSKLEVSPKCSKWN